MDDALTAFDALLARRHSCRAFLPAAVPRQDVQRILATAQRTASWCNAQPWEAHIVEGAALERLRADLMACAADNRPAAPELDWPEAYRGVYQARRRECGWGLYDAVGVPKGDREASAAQGRENFRLFGAPHLVIVSTDAALGTHGVMDCGAWVSNFMLAAAALGVATIAQAALASWPDVLRKHLALGADRKIVCGVSFGYEDERHPANGFRTTRAPLEEVVHWVDGAG